MLKKIMNFMYKNGLFIIEVQDQNCFAMPDFACYMGKSFGIDYNILEIKENKSTTPCQIFKKNLLYHM